jgi:hypothetical protein
MNNPYANIIYPADLEDLSKAFSALAQVHIRHRTFDGDNYTSYDCKHCPCVCTEPCFCVYQSVKVAYETALNTKSNHHNTKENNL